MSNRSIDKVQGLLSDIIFGPVTSRRYGVSLGVNLLPSERKVCNFNCPYCECGWTQVLDLGEAHEPVEFPTRAEVGFALETALTEMRREGRRPDAITYAGNGEPTMHPEFAGITEDSAALRDRFAPDARLVLLSNAATLRDPAVRSVLSRFDSCVMKLDTGTPEDFKAVNLPHRSHALDRIVADLAELARELPVTLQTLFIRGRYTNTSEASLAAWIRAVQRITPRAVQVYSIERAPAARYVEPVDRATLVAIADRLVRETGISAEVY